LLKVRAVLLFRIAQDFELSALPFFSHCGATTAPKLLKSYLVTRGDHDLLNNTSCDVKDAILAQVKNPRI
jgi:hypothetical protein